MLSFNKIFTYFLSIWSDKIYPCIVKNFLFLVRGQVLLVFCDCLLRCESLLQRIWLSDIIKRNLIPSFSRTSFSLPSSTYSSGNKNTEAGNGAFTLVRKLYMSIYNSIIVSSVLFNIRGAYLIWVNISDNAKCLPVQHFGKKGVELL